MSQLFAGRGCFKIYSMLRNSGSGPEIGPPGQILAGLPPGKLRNRPSGRPSAGRRADFGVFPVAVRPKSGPEALLRNIEYPVPWRSESEIVDLEGLSGSGGLKPTPTPVLSQFF